MTARTTRTAKPAAAKTVVAEEAKVINDAEHTEAAHVEADSSYEKMRAAVGAWMNANKVAMNRRALIGFILGCAVAFGTGYLLAPFLDALMLSALVTTGSLFLGVVAYIIGLVAVAIVGGKLGNIACEYVTSGKAEEHFTTAKSWVKGLFTSSKRVEAC